MAWPTLPASSAAILMDTVGSDGGGYFPQLEKMPAHNHDGVGGMHMYLPWWKFDRKNDFLRGYHTEFGGGRGMPGVGDFDDLCDDFEGYGAVLEAGVQEEIRHLHRLRRTRRNDPQRKLLLRNRSFRRRSVGHSRAALPLEVERQRNQDGEGYAGNLPRNRRSRGRSLLCPPRVPMDRIPTALPMAA